MDSLRLLGRSETEGEDISRAMWMQLCVFDKGELLDHPSRDGLLGGDQHHADIHVQLGASALININCSIALYIYSRFHCVL